MRILRALILLAVLVQPAPAFAVQPDEVLGDPALEARARVLSKELRCMVCQNQSIDDSDAPLARDLRILVRDRLKAGDSDAEVLNFLVSRYGAFVLLKPPFGWGTALLWGGPFAVLLAGLVGIWLAFRRRSVHPVESGLTADEEFRLRTWRGRDPDGTSSP